MASEIPSAVASVINQLGVQADQLIGRGGEGFVFDHSTETVLKVYRKATRQYLEQLQSLQQRATQAQLPYTTPQILRIESHDGVFYTIERKLSGKQLDIVFPRLSPEQQQTVLRNFVTALEPFTKINVEDLPYGQLVVSPDSVQAATWSEYLLQKLDQQLKKSQQFLQHDVLDFDSKVQMLRAKLRALGHSGVHKQFVHTDYYLNNVLVNEDLEISAVLDISVHAVAGDHRLDLASICFLTLDPHITNEHLDFAYNTVLQIHGPEIAPNLDIYALYYAFYYSDLHDTDQHSYNWCLSILNDETRWGRVAQA